MLPGDLLNLHPAGEQKLTWVLRLPVMNTQGQALVFRGCARRQYRLDLGMSLLQCSAVGGRLRQTHDFPIQPLLQPMVAHVHQARQIHFRLQAGGPAAGNERHQRQLGGQGLQVVAIGRADGGLLWRGGYGGQRAVQVTEQTKAQLGRQLLDVLLCLAPVNSGHSVSSSSPR